jgi:hypothetical protein
VQLRQICYRNAQRQADKAETGSGAILEDFEVERTKPRHVAEIRVF